MIVVGGGFAGCEAAWSAARRGVRVRLYEMRPHRMTPAHKTGDLAELVCSNSFKSRLPTTPTGLLKEEMAALGSIVIANAVKSAVPGGEALAVDRVDFAQRVTSAIAAEPNIEVIREAFTPDMADSALRAGETVVVATGPLTTEELSRWLAEKTGLEHLHFFDAVSPTVEADTIDRSIAFAASRYGKGGDDYLNCPMTKEEYEAFVHALVTAERVPLHEFEENTPYFAGCMPIEAIAEKGAESLRFGNFKPVGLTDPRTGRRPYAVVQLRPENADKTLYSMVACQTRLKWGEQRRVLRMIPGLAEAEFVRLGVIHRNTYVNAPRVLDEWLRVKGAGPLYLAGQITGVEGYLESAATGVVVGMIIAAQQQGRPPSLPPRESALGSLLSHLSDQTPRDFAPMNSNWGLFPELSSPLRNKGDRRAAQLARARERFAEWLAA